MKEHLNLKACTLGVQTTLRTSRNIQIPSVYYTIKVKHLINMTTKILIE